MQYQTKTCEAFGDIRGKSIPMTLRKITFVTGKQGQKSKRPHDTMPISLTANFAKNSINGSECRLYIQNYGHAVLHTVFFHGVI